MKDRFKRIDFRLIPILFCLMGISMAVISSMTGEAGESFHETFFTPYVLHQLRWYALGWLLFVLLALFDYRRLRSWSGLLYLGTIALLIGLFFTPAIQHVHRWYKIPLLGMSLQPSEAAKLTVILMLATFLEKKGERASTLLTSIQSLALVGLPFLLILKQPDLGTALLFYPIALVIGYIGGMHRISMRLFLCLGLFGLLIISLLFLEVVPHDQAKPLLTSVLKEYQYNRLDPHTWHQRAAQTAIAMGAWRGSGWHKSEFSGHQWLPAAHTDSVFAAYGEEFGLIGVIFLLALFYALIYCSFQVVLTARDPFGRLLAAGLATYIAAHLLLNMAMMCGILPISGVPLNLISYGGSSIFMTMAALGILQSIYSRRFMF